MNHKSKIVPINAPRDFAINELFFSTTDRKGIIASGNAVFSRVSHYPIKEMLGKPHNLIRHPDMPRAVFKLLWDYLLAGKPIAAYVKNMASDGRYYWVLALAAPVEDGGFLSVRFKPSSELFTIVSEVYAELRAIEQAHEDRGDGPKAGMQAAEARLGEILQAKGFADYDAFMQAMLLQELKSRDGILAHEHLAMFPTLPPHRADEGDLGAVLRELYRESQQVYGQINGLYTQLDQYARLNEQLSARSQAILKLTGEFRLICLNLTVTSSRLGDTGHTLSVISTHLGEASSRVADIVAQLTTQVGKMSRWLGATIFCLGWARLQFEMVIVYYHEILGLLAERGGQMAAASELGRLADLRYAFCQTIERTDESLQGLAKELNGLSVEIEELRKAMLSLQVTYVGGRVEASRLTENGIFASIFEDVRKHIEETKGELAGFSHVIEVLDTLAQQTPQIMRTVSNAADHMKRDQEKLAGCVPHDAAAPGTSVPSANAEQPQAA
ncbi:MAG: PAS domain-containing protein [Nitrospira sp.]|jgi:PAS domain S-box-containing protein|nr:PAS domain-containing protein [Nitrospira sp.]